jgi:S-formylglutathione hydrolase FrmB
VQPADKETTRMARKRPLRNAGTVVVLEHRSSILADNPLGDPHVRRLAVWLPPAYDRPTRGPGARFPVLYDLVGFTGAGIAHLNWKPFSDNVAERAARLVHDRRMGPVIIVFPDCFTSLGGNQYVNSSALGRYADYLIDEIIPFVDREFRTLASREHRGCFGKSSGGYGAVIHGLKYASHWGAVASHSGDAYFDFVYRADWPNTLDELAKYRRPLRRAGPVVPPRNTPAERGLREGLDDGRVRRFLETVWKKPKVSGAEVHAIMNVCMAATYDPDPGAPLGFRLPFHLDTGEIIEQRWQRWLEHDPVRLVGRHARNLRRLRGIYIDCGWRDQYHIHYGTRQLSRRLTAAGIAHRYEEFDDDHSDIDYRMDVSLPFLYRALKP